VGNVPGVGGGAVRYTLLKYALVCVSTTAWIVTLRFLFVPALPEATTMPSVRHQARLVAEREDVARPDSLAVVAAARDVFRRDRHATSIPFDPARSDNSSPAPQAPSRPALSLVGIVNGARALALIEGLPGVAGSRLLGVGDTALGFRVRVIGPDLVVLSTRDTSWTLHLRRGTM
jgi:hypothetical protein